MNLGVGITVYIDKNIRSTANLIDNNNMNDKTIVDESQSIENKIRYLIDKLTNNSNSNKNTNIYKNLKFPPLKADDFNKLKFEINIFNKTTPITLNDYFNTNNKFNLGTDGIIIIDTNTKTNKKTSKKLLTPNSYSLTNIETALNPSLNKKSLLEQLCTSELENTKSNKDCYKFSNIELFYNEGLSFS
jgi:hypothetical protein